MNINNVNPAENKKRLGFIIKKRENELYICEWNSENRSHFGTVVSFASKIQEVRKCKAFGVTYIKKQ